MASYALIKFKINNDFSEWEQAFYGAQPMAKKASAQIMNLPDDQLVRYETEKLDPNALSNQSDWMFEE